MPCPGRWRARDASSASLRRCQHVICCAASGQAVVGSDGRCALGRWLPCSIVKKRQGIANVALPASRQQEQGWRGSAAEAAEEQRGSWGVPDLYCRRKLTWGCFDSRDGYTSNTTASSVALQAAPARCPAVAGFRRGMAHSCSPLKQCTADHTARGGYPLGAGCCRRPVTATPGNGTST